MDMTYVSPKMKAVLVAKKIHPQFPSTGEGQLMFSVVNQALVDSVATDKKADKCERKSAIRYLQGSIFHAETVGVDSDWIKDVMTRVGLSF